MYVHIIIINSTLLTSLSFLFHEADVPRSCYQLSGKTKCNPCVPTDKTGCGGSGDPCCNAGEFHLVFASLLHLKNTVVSLVYSLTHCFSCILLPIILLADSCNKIGSEKTCQAPDRRFLAPQYWRTRKGSNPLPSPSVSKPKGHKLKGSEVKAQWWKKL